MNLSPEQLSQVLDNALVQHGLNKVLEIILNCLMKLERSEFLRLASDHNKANGYRFGRAFGLGSEIKLLIPRDRLGQFYPVLLTIIKNQEAELQDLAFILYSKGLSVRDVSDIFDKLYGASYSKSSISRINQSFVEEMMRWRNRELDNFYPVIIIDALYTKIRRDSKVESEAIYVIMGLKDDMTRDIIAIENFPQESASGWGMIFESLKERGVEKVNLVIADGLSGLETSITKAFPVAKLQKCVTHFKRNVLNKVRNAHKAEIAEDLRNVFVTDDPSMSQEDGIENLSRFIDKWGKHYRFVRNFNTRLDIPYYFTYLKYNKKVRSMIYTTNWIEALNKQFRRVLKIRNSMPSDESVLLLITKIAMDKVEKYLQYPIYNFKFDQKLMNRK